MARRPDRPHEDCYSWLVEARARAGLTQKQLAGMAGLSANYVSQLESGYFGGSPATQLALRKAIFSAKARPAWPPPLVPAKDRTTLLYHALVASGYLYRVSVSEIRSGAKYASFARARTIAHYLMTCLGFSRQESAMAIGCDRSATYYFDSQYKRLSEADLLVAQEALLWLRESQDLDKRNRIPYLSPHES